MSPAEIYEALRADAATGDRKSMRMLEAIDAFLASKRLSIVDLGNPTQNTVTRDVGPIQLRVVNNAPWSVSIRNLTTFGAPTDLDAYVALRTGALRSLAAATPDREIRVVITPASLISLDQFIDVLKCDCVATELVADVFVDGIWAFSSFRSIEGPLDNAPNLIGTQAVEAAFVHLEGVAASQLQVQVRQIQVKTTAAEARRMSDLAEVLLIDPLDDLADEYRGQAAFIEVTGMPDVFYSHAAWRLGVDLNADSPHSRQRE